MRCAFPLLLVCLTALPPAAPSAEPSGASLGERLTPWFHALSGQAERFQLDGVVNAEIDGKPQRIKIRLTRFDDQQFDLQLDHDDYALTIRRRADKTALALPRHQVVFVGEGSVDSRDHLAPAGLGLRLVSPRTQVMQYLAIVREAKSDTLAAALTGLLGVRFSPDQGVGTAGDAQFRFDGVGLQVRDGETLVMLSLTTAGLASPEPADQWPDYRTVELERAELERTLARGAARALEILAPSAKLTSPDTDQRSTPHGRLLWIEGQRVALLRGTPEQVGRAHGELLAEEARACIDSVLHTFGTVQTVRTGRWFRHDLETAYARLAPHIPERHKAETRALAKALGVAPELGEALNVFPELFHCSGFAVFGSATSDGKLYHGRVLDYMTTIGLQDAATTFVVEVEGRIPFVNVGYAGFIGSVSGMNARAVSLGEMGGRGEGQWDGVPMATLMRRALEECETLEEVMRLWETSPRTCEYFYVFADGKTNQAVGVAATPEKIEFIRPGEAHELLGEGIRDAVVLSAGSRLEKLRERVQQKHGELDAESGKWLMSRPVAMQSNLHNVLFVPADQVLHVANAGHGQPAAERPYVKLDFRALLDSLPRD